MDDTASTIIEREAALADFDHARDDFEDAVLSLPGGSLKYKAEGDDYSIADMVPHITHMLQTYTELLQTLREMEFREVTVAAAPDQTARLEQHRKAHKETTPKLGHRTALDEMEAAHDRLAGMLREIALEEYTRQGTVRSPGAEEAYLASGSDILGWMTGHYREHAEQVAHITRAN
ncbi:MAG: DinB family protein [Chloroflexota bacterium]|nr:DinB family protein [Chloroflexota bacterium]